MIDPKRAIIILTATVLLPGAALANTGTCPDMSAALSVIKPDGKGGEIDQAKLAEEVGKASASPLATKGLSDELHDHLPGNEEAAIADLMIAAYCEHLETSKSDVNLDQSVQDYQTFLYNDVFTDPAGTVEPAEKRPEGWLWGND
ncbi:MAG: hypothetical protein AAGA28_10575 [Pseudomonadota bacterium]